MLDWTVRWHDGTARTLSQLSNAALNMVEHFLRNGMATVETGGTVEGALHRIEIERIARRHT